MTTAELLPKAKKWLGYSSTVMDEEIEDDMEACLLDLKNSGVVVLDPADKLVATALKFHLKAYVEHGADWVKWDNSYEHLKKALSLSDDYNTEREVKAGD